MNTEEQLQSETKKWLAKVKAERPRIELVDKSKTDFLQNIDAYVADAEHFMSKKDFVRAFEAVVWAFSWLEIGEGIGILKKKLEARSERSERRSSWMRVKREGTDPSLYPNKPPLKKYSAITAQKIKPATPAPILRSLWSISRQSLLDIDKNTFRNSTKERSFGISISPNTPATAIACFHCDI